MSSEPTQQPDPVAATYRQRAATFGVRRDAEQSRSTRLSSMRLVTFLLILAAGLWAELRPGPAPLVAVAIGIAAFVSWVILHGRVRRRHRRFAALVALNEEGLLRLRRAWKELPPREAPGGEHSSVAAELDLFGRPALAQLAGPTATPQGADALAVLLLASATGAEIAERQAAVRDLAHRIDFRDDLAAEGRLEDLPAPAAIARFLEWADRGSVQSPLPVWVTWGVPALNVVCVALVVAGLAPPSLLGVPLLVAATLTFGGPGRRARAEFRRAFGREEAFRAYPALFERAGAETFEASLLRKTRDRLSTGPFAATSQMQRLASLAHLAGLRDSAMLYVPVQLLTLWDFHVLRSVHAWRADAGSHVREWFEALGRIEALAALGTLAHDHPDWTYAEIAEEPLIEAEGIGHPMIAADRRVDNDVTVGPPGTFLLITGSNMSGKSTLLRAIAQNTRLAMAGAPACARSLRLPPVELRTSFHVEDSLADGVSLFMAQLNRVKQIVEAADAAAERGEVLLYLLDEMLQGTNTAERRIGSTRVLRHLLDSGCIGAVTTHDLALADVPELRDSAVPVHFRETVHPDRSPAITFDYALRPGVATSTNALRLMEIVGLGD